MPEKFPKFRFIIMVLQRYAIKYKYTIRDILLILFIFICILLFFGCELHDYDREKDNHDMQMLLNTHCDTEGEIRFYPAGVCVWCEYGTWREYDCDDFCR